SCWMTGARSVSCTSTGRTAGRSSPGVHGVDSRTSRPTPYVSHSPPVRSTRPTSCATTTHFVACSTTTPLMASVDDCRLLQLPRTTRAQGSLTPVQGGTDVPFDIARVYYLYDVPGG